jgi:hypothetical protein
MLQYYKSLKGEKMKKLSLIAFIAISFLQADCLIENKFDAHLYDDNYGCFNATDGDSIKSITTKLAGKEFTLLIKRDADDANCTNIKNAKYSFFDLTANKEITSQKDIVKDKFIINAEFNTSYRNLKVKFDYDRDEYKIKYQEIECPWRNEYNFAVSMISTNFPEYKKTEDISKEEEIGHYYESLEKCYVVNLEKETKHYTEYSTDNFAVRPQFDINIKKHVKTGRNIPFTINAVNEHGDIDDKYSTSSLYTNVTSNKNIPIQYAFDIKNGKSTSSSVLFFTKPAEDVKVIITEKPGYEWAIVDADDTADSCRLVSGESKEINITDASKSWAGAGTDKEYNNPSQNSIQSNVKQNIKKDLHFNRLSW